MSGVRWSPHHLEILVMCIIAHQLKEETIWKLFNYGLLKHILRSCPCEIQHFSFIMKEITHSWVDPWRKVIPVNPKANVISPTGVIFYYDTARLMQKNSLIQTSSISLKEWVKLISPIESVSARLFVTFLIALEKGINTRYFYGHCAIIFAKE